MRRPALLPILALVLLPFAAIAPPAGAREPGDAGEYVRLQDEGGRMVLEIAAREMVPAEGRGPAVWLVGAIHVADAAYYAAVQDLLDGHDLVLYEAVMAPGAGRLRDDDAAARVEDTRRRLVFLAGAVRLVVRGGAPLPADAAALVRAARAFDARLAHQVAGALVDAWGGAIRLRALDAADFRLTSLGADGRPGGADEDADLFAGPEEGAAFLDDVRARAYNLQKEMAEALDLVWQGDAVDYDRSHFVPSDMDLAELVRAIAARDGDPAFIESALAGGGLSGLVARFFIGALRFAGALTGGRLTTVAKMMLVSMLARSDVQEGRSAGIDQGTMDAILLDRNAVLLGDLDAVLAAFRAAPGAGGGDGAGRTVGVFYGAAHMADLERGLVDRGYVPGATRWLAAIEVDLEATGLSRERLDRMRAGMQRSLERRMGQAEDD